MKPTMHPDRPALTRRPETAQDSAFLETLYRSTRDDLLQSGLPEAVLANLLDMQFRAQQASYRTQFPHADFTIVELAGVAIGGQVLHEDARGFRLVNIALLPQARNRSYGRHLLLDLQEQAAASGKPLWLAVSMQNLAAQRLYRSLGFQICGGDEASLEMVWWPAASR